MADRVYLEWTDIAAGYLRSANWAIPGGSPAAFSAAMQAASNANLGIVTEGIGLVGVTAASSAQYPLVTDTAAMTFMTTGLNQVRLVLPSPVAAVFGTGQSTVDPTNPLVAAIIAAVTGYLADGSGNLVTAYVQGVKASRKVEQNG